MILYFCMVCIRAVCTHVHTVILQVLCTYINFILILDKSLLKDMAWIKFKFTD